MPEDFNTFLNSCVRLMLRPIVAFCVSRGVRIQDFMQLAKEEFVTSARKKLQDESISMSVSRLSVMTGVQRPEVSRILENPSERQSKDFIGRIIGQWTSDRRFGSRTRPNLLGTEGAHSDFAKLVTAVSKDLNPHTVRFELERLGVIEVKNRKAKLMTRFYDTSGDSKNTFLLGSLDVADLLNSIQENAFVSHQIPNLQARTEYDNIPDDALHVIRQWLLEAGTALHDDARAFISKFDRDINGVDARGDGRNRVVIGTYSRVEPKPEEEN